MQRVMRREGKSKKDREKEKEFTTQLTYMQLKGAAYFWVSFL